MNEQVFRSILRRIPLSGVLAVVGLALAAALALDPRFPWADGGVSDEVRRRAELVRRAETLEAALQAQVEPLFVLHRVREIAASGSEAEAQAAFRRAIEASARRCGVRLASVGDIGRRELLPQLIQLEVRLNATAETGQLIDWLEALQAQRPRIGWSDVNLSAGKRTGGSGTVNLSGTARLWFFGDAAEVRP